jgi:hypothetical protein
MASGTASEDDYMPIGLEVIVVLVVNCCTAKNFQPWYNWENETRKEEEQHAGHPPRGRNE